MFPNEVNILNEEDLKEKIILPYLDSLGISVDELEFERGFSIKLGRNSYRINDNKQKKTTRGRLDILCKQGNINLFVIEAKADNIKITQKDIDQGISYARLLDQIAPFVLVTNGKESYIFDTITKKDLTNKKLGEKSYFWKNGCTLSGKDELNYRYEALKKFIGYSNKNLEMFSKSQITNRMSVLKGNNDNLTKKYIPELFLKNNELFSCFSSFLKSTDLVFPIIGKSGVGKTNQICNLTETYSSKYITIFLNGSNIYNPIFEEIKQDFNWVFSPNLEIQEIINRLIYLAKLKETKIIIFIDAIDEIPYQNVINDLNAFIRKLNKFKNIKVCVSCKINEWNKFLENRGNPSILKESIYKPLNSEDSLPGYLLRTFKKKDLNKIYKKYKKGFNLDGNLRGQLLKECKLGFMLRVVAEVYSGKKIPNKIDDIELAPLILDKL